MFGVQWDLVLKHLNNKGVSDSLLKDDSSSWGNYCNSQFEINRGEYNTGKPYNNFIEYTTTTENQVTVENGVSTKVGTTYTYRILLTTGASDTNSQYNIYDLAGNVGEWTLEKTSDPDNPCAGRGGGTTKSGSDSTVSNRPINHPTQCFNYVGFRCTLY